MHTQTLFPYKKFYHYSAQMERIINSINMSCVDVCVCIICELIAASFIKLMTNLMKQWHMNDYVTRWNAKRWPMANLGLY